ncbi:putative oxidoreductase [Prosthecobacter debontii]|uniref:Putative oxidoreductase n=1 Tax=Prosthecobacter debontii TaxID=48467 RepID=A0A1T4Z0D2_9BACT|nr:DoxX family protein [Prosthecobacter debontii]SKB07363.1 putative oxidoreductase [Prosthecobacter debontii]
MMTLPQLWTNLNRTVDQIAAYLPDPLLLGIRLYWGWQFFVTGKGKLMNLEATAGFFSDLGLPLPKLQALLAGSTECFGGLLLLAGLASRLTAVPLIFTMAVAYLTAHREVVVGIWEDSDAFVTAPPFLFLFAAVIVFVFGPGKFSADALLRRPTAV